MGKFISDEEMSKLEAQEPKTKRFISDEEMATLEKNEGPSEVAQATKAAGLGTAQGASLGWADELESYIRQIAKDVSPALNPFGSTDKAPEVKRDNMGRVTGGGAGYDPKELEGLLGEVRGRYDKAAEDNPIAYGVGNVVGSLASSVAAPMLAGSQGASLAARMGGAALGGGISGAGLSNAGSMDEMAKDAALGALMSGGMQGVSEKVISPAAKWVGGKLPNMADLGEKISGVDADAIRFQVKNTDLAKAAEADDFTFGLAKKAQDEIEQKAGLIGGNVDQAKRHFMETLGSADFNNDGLQLANKIDDFLAQNKPSGLGFSGVGTSQQKELLALSKKLKSGEVAGDDVLKLRDYIDHEKRVAGNYDKEGTGPYINFLKGLRGEADSMVDAASPTLDKANTMFAEFVENKRVLGLNNDTTVEGVIGNLFGANKTAKQQAAKNLLSPETYQGAEVIAANKAFGNATRPGGDNYFRRGAMAVLTSGISEAVTNPSNWKRGARLVGTIQNNINKPEFVQKLGRFAAPLAEAAKRGPAAISATHFLLSQQSPEYRQMLQEGEE